jgi:hypothetical protein
VVQTYEANEGTQNDNTIQIKTKENFGKAESTVGGPSDVIHGKADSQDT